MNIYVNKFITIHLNKIIIILLSDSHISSKISLDIINHSILFRQYGTNTYHDTINVKNIGFNGNNRVIGLIDILNFIPNRIISKAYIRYSYVYDHIGFKSSIRFVETQIMANDNGTLRCFGDLTLFGHDATRYKYVIDETFSYGNLLFCTSLYNL